MAPIINVEEFSLAVENKLGGLHLKHLYLLSGKCCRRVFWGGEEALVILPSDV